MASTDAAAIEQAIRSLRLIVFDFDGVFTDNTVIVTEDGQEAVVCWRGDGLGLSKIRRRGIEMRIISTEVNPVVTARSRKLQLECLQGCDDKLTALKALATQRGLSAGEIAFMGNDINDAECLAWVGLPVVPADAHEAVVPLARLTMRASGGRGAVREFCDLVDGVLAR